VVVLLIVLCGHLTIHQLQFLQLLLLLLLLLPLCVLLVCRS
jgi:hypothetical protein